ncbi:MAG: FAD-dependent oxidoreductase, partial [Verrucomicrobiales bacterium]|nr:FAD-dependent oxidoreductase [Verrucomicrobiales bacterium]
MSEEIQQKVVDLDVAVIGGGVAALWTANALQDAGFGGRFALFSNSPLGAGQSLAAQGVIHGGLKYALGGKLNDASEELAAMPDRWANDLPGVRVLSQCQYLWSLPSVLSKVVSFLGSKSVRGRAEKIARENFPVVFDSDGYG